MSTLSDKDGDFAANGVKYGMSWQSSDHSPNAESKLIRRDPALHVSLGAVYLSPAHGFNELAPTYDQRLAGNPLFGVESTATLAFFPMLEGKSVADVGCGTGRLSLQIARMGAGAVIGVDLSEEMLAVAVRKTVRAGDLAEVVTWRRGDLLERLPFPDCSVDVAVCALTLSFLPDVGGAFRELSRIISPGGSLVVSDYHPHGLVQARADATALNGNKDKAPYLRFTSAGGDDCRITQYVHTISDLFRAGQDAGLTLRQISEPVADSHLANTYAAHRERSGAPLAVIARFDK
ncbi:MAG: methyltransferase domain-containing protein [Akkermansiaceae bacterium]|nr:methyltransferase domain-containing protein [Armatimonadota bacterium]